MIQTVVGLNPGFSPRKLCCGQLTLSRLAPCMEGAFCMSCMSGKRMSNNNKCFIINHTAQSKKGTYSV